MVRHGLTARTGVKLSGWTPGIQLNRIGVAQAEDLVARFEGVPLDAVYASPLERTAQTAEPLARVRGLKVRTREEIGEVRYGSIEGKSLKVLAKSKLWQDLRSWPSNVRFPDGESLRETQARAVGAIERLRDAHPDGSVAVFSHGDWIRLAMAHFMGVHVDLYRRLMVEPVSVSVVHLTSYGPLVWRLNDTGNLADIKRPYAHPPKGRGGR